MGLVALIGYWDCLLSFFPLYPPFLDFSFYVIAFNSIVFSDVQIPFQCAFSSLLSSFQSTIHDLMERYMFLGLLLVIWFCCT